MGALLGWDEATKAAEIERYEGVVAQSRAWRAELESTDDNAAEARVPSRA